MASIRTPKDIQPAFNEVVFTDDGNTELVVEGVYPSPEESVTLHRMIMVDPDEVIPVTRFDAHGFVSTLFTDERIPVTPAAFAGIPGWCFEDYNLKVKYQVDGRSYLALNAVRQVGKSLDLFRTGESAILTEHDNRNGFRSIPAYEGYPVGATVMAKSWYEIDLDTAFLATYTIPANTTISIHITGSGIIVWGDGIVERAGATGTYSHVFVNAGAYQVGVVADTGAILSLPTTTSGQTTIATGGQQYMTSIDQWGQNFGQYRIGATAATRVPYEPLPASVTSLHSFFTYNTNITALPVNLFANLAHVTNAQSLFHGSVNLSLPEDILKGRSGCCDKRRTRSDRTIHRRCGETRRHTCYRG